MPEVHFLLLTGRTNKKVLHFVPNRMRDFHNYLHRTALSHTGRHFSPTVVTGLCVTESAIHTNLARPSLPIERYLTV